MTYTAGIVIRGAVPGDVPLILGLIRELAEYERLSGAVVANEALLREHLFPEPDDHNRAAEVLIGEIDGRAEGFALFFANFSTFLARPGVYLEDLYVRPRARGRGLGAALFAAVARKATERRAGRMEWAVLDWNEPAIGFYRKMGAVAMEEWTVHRLAGEALARAAHDRGA